MRLKLTVPKAKAQSMPGIAATGTPNAKPTTGAIRVSGNPVITQCAAVLPSTKAATGWPDSTICSSVPSSASSRKSPSKDNCEASSAPTQSTPGAICRSLPSSGV